MLKLKRYEGNPILSNVPGEAFHSKYIYNSGATIHNGKVVLLYRAEGDYKRPRIESKWPVTMIGYAESDDGFHFTTQKDPVIRNDLGEDELWGLEDPRISKIGDTYYIIVIQVGPKQEGNGNADKIALVTTKDFVNFERKWRLMPEVNQRTSALLPGKINNEYVLIHRITPNMQIAYSSDLKEWHGSKALMEIKPESDWENLKIGVCGQPVETEKGWLMIYHAVQQSKPDDPSDRIYRLGLAWLDLNDPSKVIKRLDYPILEPEADYERVGLTNNVVYSCGAVIKDNQLIVYYGAADAVLCAATAPMEEVYATL